MTAAAALSAKAEWKVNWPLVLTGALGSSLTTVYVYTMGLFFQPLEQEMGWSRSQISFGLTIHAILSVPLMPLFGILIDRWGGRRIAIPGVALYGMMFASLSLVGGSAYYWWAMWAGIALAALGVKQTLWVMAVSSRFVTARGTAIALVLCGTAISSFFAPMIARWLIDLVGWRLTYAYMGLGWALVVLVLVLLFFYDSRDRQRIARKSTGAAEGERIVLPGLSFSQAIRDPAFIKLALSSLLVSLAITGTVIHLVPMLTLRGLSRETAAGVLSVLGIAAAFGKFGTGWLFDRMDARPIATLCLALPAVPLLLLAFVPEGQTMSVAVAVTIVALLGFTSGAELSVTAYLTTRYVGLRSFGQNYGVIASIMAIAAGFAPLIASLIFDRTGGYELFLFGAAPMALLAGMMVFTLPRYPDWTESSQAAR